MTRRARSSGPADTGKAVVAFDKALVLGMTADGRLLIELPRAVADRLRDILTGAGLRVTPGRAA